MSGWAAAGAAAADLIGGWLNREEAEDERYAQREFAQQGIRWRVADAKAAGLHPLAAIGAAGASYSPVLSGIGDSVASAGQNLSRAFQATRTQDERTATQKQLDALMLKKAENDVIQGNHEIARMQLENDLLRNRVVREGLGTPAFPSAAGFGTVGETGSTLVNLKKSDQVMADPRAAGVEASLGAGKPGFIPMAIGGNMAGYTLDVPNSDLSEALEGMSHAGAILGPAIWASHLLGRGADKLLGAENLGPPRKGYRWKMTRNGWKEVPLGR